jgi:hypothetical protein
LKAVKLLQSGATMLTAGQQAEIPFDAFDQYGSKFAGTVNATNSTIYVVPSGVVTTAYSGSKIIVTADSNITVDSTVKIVMVAHNGGAQSEATLNVYRAKAPTTVEFGSFTDVVSTSDSTAFLPITVTDQFGVQLTPAEIATAYSDNKFTVFTSNSSVAGTVSIETATGSNQGKVKVETFSNVGTAGITVLINGTSSQATFSLSVSEARVPHEIRVANTPAAKLLAGATESKNVFRVYDQYGKLLESNTANYSITLTLAKKSGDNDAITVGGVAALNNATKIATDIEISDVSNKAITFTADDTKKGVIEVKAELIKDSIVINSKSVEVESIAVSAADSLTYSINNIGTLFAHESINDGNINNVAKYRKQITVTAKDSNNVTVKLPSVIDAVYVSDSTLLTVDVDYRVSALDKEGSAVVTVVFTPDPLSGSKIVTQTVTISDVAPTIDALTAGKTSKSITRTNLIGTTNIWDAKLAEKIEVKDSYGVVYKNEKAAATDHAALSGYFQVRYYVSDVKWTNSSNVGTLTIGNESGVVTYAAGDGGNNHVQSFKVQVVSLKDGKTVEITITVTE